MPAAESVRVRLRRLWEEGRAHPEIILLIAIVAAGGAARYATLGLQSFDSGETITAARILRSSYEATFHAYSTIERSGPIYYTLAWVWSKVFGTTEVGLRSLSAIFGTATIVVAYLIARELVSRRAGLFAAALTAAGPDLFWYSQEARSYPLFIFFTALGVYFFARALRRPSAANHAGWAIASALALSAHYFSAFPVGIEAAWLATVAWRRGSDRRRALTAIGAVAAVGFALLPLAIHQEGSGRQNGFTSIPVLERAATSLAKFMTGEGPSTSGRWVTMPEASRVLGLIAAVACLAAIVLLLVSVRGEAKRRLLAVASVAGGAFVLPLVLALGGLDYVEPRNLLGSLVPMLALAGCGVEVAGRFLARRRALAGVRLAPALGLALPCCVMLVITAAAPQFQRDNWRDLSGLVARPGDVGVLLTQPPSAGKALNYYFGRGLPRLAPPDYPCGVRTRKIVTLSSSKPEPVTGPFRLVSYRRTAQGWIVATYIALRPHRVNAPELRVLDVLSNREEARVVDGKRVEPKPYRPRLVRQAARSPWAGGAGPTRRAGPGPCVAYDGTIALRSS